MTKDEVLVIIDDFWYWNRSQNILWPVPYYRDNTNEWMIEREINGYQGLSFFCRTLLDLECCLVAGGMLAKSTR